jgi:amino acid adenylation domain-containing protein
MTASARHPLLHDLVRRSAERFPSRPAIQCRDETMTYAQLDSLSNRLARTLVSAGVGRGDRVALFLEKGTPALVAIHAILKTGAAYVPIDPLAPPKRARYILEDCLTKALITTGDSARRLELASAKAPDAVIVADESADHVVAGERRRVIAWSQCMAASDAPVEVDGRPEDLAYILYTSGSTGSPKGVMISHLAALTFVDWATTEFRLTPEDRLSNHAPLHFDLSIFDIFGAAEAGALVAVVPHELSVFPLELTGFIEQSRITVWYSVPSALIRLALYGRLESSDLSSLRTVLFAGEVFPTRFLRRLRELLPKAEMYNLYGPTETNVCAFYHVVSLPENDSVTIPIGRACAGCETVVCDSDGRPVRTGEEGELLVRGSSLMSGYWGRSDLSRQAMREVGAGGREGLFYGTGDIVREDPAGDYLYLGRRDDMIKSRGYRIELGEIEAALYSHPAVEVAAALAVPHDEFGALIKAVIVTRAGVEAGEGEIKAHCAERLPKYMIPDFVEFRRTVPRTSSGKVDKRRLLSESAGKPDTA